MENARISRERRRMIMNNKTQRGGISVRSRSSSMQITNYNSVQPTDSTSQSMTDNRSEMENARLTQHKRRKTNQGAIRVGSESSSSQNRNYNSIQPTDSTGQSMREGGSSYGSDREDIPSK
jgi:hypothetical protein